MSPLPSSPPPISPVPQGVERPQWSVMIPAFNAGRYLGGTLQSVLAQAPPADQMQICVVDDASTDIDVRQLVSEMGQGRIEYVRQPHNVGSVANYNKCVELARGHWVHLLHADDRVQPGFYAGLGDLFVRYPEAGAAFCRHRHIDSDGNEGYVTEAELPVEGLVPHWLQTLATEQRLQFVCIAIRRSVYEALGGFFGAEVGVDWEMWVRIASRYPFAYTPRTLADYRVHGASITGAKLVSGQNVEELLWAVKATARYLPPDVRDSVAKQAVALIALDAVRSAGNLWRWGFDAKSVRSLLAQALSLSRAPRLCWWAVKLYIKTVLNIRR